MTVSLRKSPGAVQVAVMKTASKLPFQMLQYAHKAESTQHWRLSSSLASTVYSTLSENGLLLSRADEADSVKRQSFNLKLCNRIHEELAGVLQKFYQHKDEENQALIARLKLLQEECQKKMLDYYALEPKKEREESESDHDEIKLNDGDLAADYELLGLEEEADLETIEDRFAELAYQHYVLGTLHEAAFLGYLQARDRIYDHLMHEFARNPADPRNNPTPFYQQAQNTHNSEVTGGITIGVARLKAHYGKNLKVEQSLAKIQKAIDAYPVRNEQDAEVKRSAQARFDFVKSAAGKVHGTSLQEAAALVYENVTDPRVVVHDPENPAANSKRTATDIEDGQRRLVRFLAEAQNEYGKNSSSCFQGTFNKIVQAADGGGYVDIFGIYKHAKGGTQQALSKEQVDGAYAELSRDFKGHVNDALKSLSTTQASQVLADWDNADKWDDQNSSVRKFAEQVQKRVDSSPAGKRLLAAKDKRAGELVSNLRWMEAPQLSPAAAETKQGAAAEAQAQSQVQAPAPALQPQAMGPEHELLLDLVSLGDDDDFQPQLKKLISELSPAEAKEVREGWEDQDSARWHDPNSAVSRFAVQLQQQYDLQHQPKLEPKPTESAVEAAAASPAPATPSPSLRPTLQPEPSTMMTEEEKQQAQLDCRKEQELYQHLAGRPDMEVDVEVMRAAAAEKDQLQENQNMTRATMGA